MSESKPIVLRSTANRAVRHLVRMRDNRARRKAGRVLVDGWRETAAALDAGLNLCGIYLPESMLDGDGRTGDGHDDEAIGRVIERVGDSPKAAWVSAGVMNRIGYGQSSRGVVGEFDQPDCSLDDLQLPPSPLILILDQIEKPGNIGAVFRCADAAGVDAILLCDGGDPWNPNAIRSSLGCVFHVSSASGSQGELLEFLRQRSIRILAARVESAEPLWSANLRGPLAVVLGSEAAGLGNRWMQAGRSVIDGVQIPMTGKVDSLNVSVSAAVIAFEVQRRRQTESGN